MLQEPHQNLGEVDSRGWDYLEGRDEVRASAERMAGRVEQRPRRLREIASNGCKRGLSAWGQRDGEALEMHYGDPCVFARRRKLDAEWEVGDELQDCLDSRGCKSNKKKETKRNETKMDTLFKEGNFEIRYRSCRL